MAKALNRRLRTPVFAVDLRNHGQSPSTAAMTYELMAADCHRFVVDVALPTSHCDRVHLLGHSMGKTHSHFASKITGGKVAALMALQPHVAKTLASVIIEDITPKPYGKAGNAVV